MLPNPPATLRQLFRRRPAAVAVVENALGAAFWEHLDDPLPDFCDRFRLPSGDLADKVAALPPVPADAEWSAQPLCYLIDRLAAEHDEFRRNELPRLRSVLDGIEVRSWTDRYALDLIRQDFEAFHRDLLLHLDEEEELAFPELLRRESLARHRLKGRSRKGKREAEGLQGDWTLPTRSDEDIGRMLVDLAEKFRHQQVSAEAANGWEAFRRALEAFQARLERHARLEIEELYPRVAKVEAEAAGTASPRMWRS